MDVEGVKARSAKRPRHLHLAVHALFAEHRDLRARDWVSDALENPTRLELEVEEQSRVDYVESSIPSRSSASTTNTLPSNRTTSSSEQSIPLSRQRTLPPPISHADLIASQSSTPVPAARVVSKTESRPRTLRHTRPRIPFPQGPPGSGFPLLLKQDPPRSENGESRSKVSDSIAKFQVEVFVWSS